MGTYEHPLFWSAIACGLGAVVVCALVARYGFTRDTDPAGRWGWRPTRAGHGVAAALFGTGVALAILALTAVPLGGTERPLGAGLRARLEILRGRVDAFDHAVARLGDNGLRRTQQTASALPDSRTDEGTHAESRAIATSPTRRAPAERIVAVARATRPAPAERIVAMAPATRPAPAEVSAPPAKPHDAHVIDDAARPDPSVIKEKPQRPNGLERVAFRDRLAHLLDRVDNPARLERPEKPERPERVGRR